MKSRTPLEKTIEASFLKKMKMEFPNVKCIKMNMMFQRSWPDRMMILPHGEVAFIEFKREGGVATPQQKDCHDYLRSMGHFVGVFFTAEDAMRYIKEILNV